MRVLIKKALRGKVIQVAGGPGRDTGLLDFRIVEGGLSSRRIGWRGEVVSWGKGRPTKGWSR